MTGIVRWYDSDSKKGKIETVLGTPYRIHEYTTIIKPKDLKNIIGKVVYFTLDRSSVHPIVKYVVLQEIK